MQAEPPVALFVNELRHYNKSAVCPGILTGGKGQELVAVFGGYARIVKRQFLTPLNIGCEIIGGLRIDELIIFEAVGTIRIYIRPVLILQNNVGNRHSPTVIAAPITSKMGKPRLPTHVCLNRQANGLSCGSVILLEQLRTIDKSRLRERVGALDTSEMKQIDWALGVSVGLAEGYR